MPCPAPTQIADCLNGKLDEPVSRVLFAHLETCSHCQQVASDLDGQSDSFVGEIRASSVMLESPMLDSQGSCFEMIEKAESLAVGEGSSAVLDELDKTPRRIRDYQILEPLGFGGMGEVYRARHIRLKRDVAIKLISEHRTDNEVALKFFQQEMEAVGRLEQHPHLVQALDAGEYEGIQYLVMQLVDGQNVEQLLRQKEYLDVADVCEIGRQAALGLHFAHQQGLIHRDVKPTNLMVSAGGGVQVMDLGLSMFRSAEGAMKQVLGSVQYMAPEQADRNAEVDVRTDVYGLGGTLYFLLTGKAPHQTTSYKSLQRRIHERTRASLSELTQVRKDVPLTLRELLEELLAPSAGERPKSAAEVARRLSPFTEGSDLFELMAEYRAGAECGEAVVADVADMPESETEESVDRWVRFRVVLFGLLAVMGLVLSVVVWRTMFPSNPREFDTTAQEETRGDEPNPLESQFVAKRTDYQFSFVSDGKRYVFTNAPGFEIFVTVADLNSDSPIIDERSAWDVLEFKMKYPQEFALYERGWAASESDFERLFPLPESKLAEDFQYLRKVEFGDSECRVTVREAARSIRLTEYRDGRIRMAISYPGGRSEAEFAGATQMRTQSQELSELYRRYSTTFHEAGE